MKHLIWDWNGTLFNDTSAVVAAARAILAPYRTLTTDEYRAAHCRPIVATYEKLLGRPLSEEERVGMDLDFDRYYHQNADVCVLAPGIPDLLDRWRGRGGSQSLLSMARHDPLLVRVCGFGIDGLFNRVDGLPGDWPSGGGKAEHLKRHLARLRVDPADALLIGDSVDDAVAAGTAGAGAVLYSGGVTARDVLEGVGVPVVDSLQEAVGYAA